MPDTGVLLYLSVGASILLSALLILAFLCLPVLRKRCIARIVMVQVRECESVS
jgi:hypothetical protein